MSEQKRPRAGRNIRIKVTDDISHTGLTEQQYDVLEKFHEKMENEQAIDEASNFDLEDNKNNESKLSTLEEKIVLSISETQDIDVQRIREVIRAYKELYKKQTGKVI
ncbi:hypothetical protein E5161_09570 [Cohnella pontilimi]|uniref:Uncharacterized protein n=1 Tax=Cohnella pontilimi TaxID=2564100 RepID=A0A4U0FBN1_9BACL|nr:hypothetical protein [Cohnella pontilimi]TJY42246.1 hypothetical protein E5161_09570 [Cohnella pontilimi]